MANADYALQYYIDKGWSPYAAAGIVGNFQQESGQDLNPLTIHDKGTGFGIAGWRDEKPGVGRKSNLLRFAKENKLNPRDLDTQLAFGDYELRNSEAHVGQELKSAKSADEAAHAMIHYERPQGYTLSDPTKAMGYKGRINNARNLFSSYTGGTYDPTPASKGTMSTASADEVMPRHSVPIYGGDPAPYDSNKDNWDPTIDRGVGTKPEKSRASKMASAFARGVSSASAGDAPIDMQAGGANMDVPYAPVEGVDINAYKQYAGQYANGGVVKRPPSVSEYFKRLMG